MSTDRWQRAGDTWGDYLDRFCAGAPLTMDALPIREWGRTAVRDADGTRRTDAGLLQSARAGEAMRQITPTLRQMAESMRRFGAAARAATAAVITSGGEIERWAREAGGRVVVKRLRHGGERHRIVMPRAAQPAPWKRAR